LITRGKEASLQEPHHWGCSVGDGLQDGVGVGKSGHGKSGNGDVRVLLHPIGGVVVSVNLLNQS